MPHTEYKSLVGDIEIKAASSNKMQFSGWVSTPSADLTDEVVEADAFKKHWVKYMNNPVYCWQHDRNQPIGKVISPQLTEKGVYLEDVTLSEIPLVTECLWKLVKDGVLTQQSIGFLSLDMARKGKFMHHTEVYLLESSLVTVACNPDAVIDVVKNFGNYTDIDAVVKDYYSGRLDFSDPKRKNYYMSNGNSNRLAKNGVEPDFTKFEAMAHNTDKYDPEGEETPKPTAYNKNYADINSLIYAAVKTVGNENHYLCQIGVPTKKGFKYSWEKSCVSMCRLLGAKGDASFDATEKEKIISRVAAAYIELEKTVPTVTIDGYELSVDQLVPEELARLKYKDVNFHEDEDVFFSKTVLENDLKNVDNVLRHYAKNGTLTKEFKDLVNKYVGGYFSISGYIEDQEDADLISRLMNLLVEQNASEAEPASAYDYAAPEDTSKAKTSQTPDELKKAILELFKEIS